MHSNTIRLYFFFFIITFSLFALCDINPYIHHPAALGAMSTQTSARGASRSRGRAQPRTDSEPRSDSERTANDQKRVAAKAAKATKSSFSIRGAATLRGSPLIKTGDGGARSQVGQRARRTEQQQISSSSRGNGRGSRADSSVRGGTRSQVANNSESGDQKPKGDGIQGHFVEYLSGGSTARGKGSTKTGTRGSFGIRGGSRTQSDRTLFNKSFSKSSPAMGSLGQAWRDPRRDGTGNYMQSMAEYFQTVCIPSFRFTNWQRHIVTWVS